MTIKNIKASHIIWIVLSGAAILGMRYFIFPPKFLPGEFLDARIKGANIAQGIVEFSRKNLATLSSVAEFDREGNRPEALIAIAKAVAENRQAQLEAIRLSSQLDTMAQNLSRVRPGRARELGSAAITAQITSVTRLLYYGNYMEQLYEALKAKFDDPRRAYLDGQVNEIVGKLNDEAQAINELNKRFAEVMAEFDKIFENN